MQRVELKRVHSKCVARVLLNCIGLMQKSGKENVEMCSIKNKKHHGLAESSKPS
jgi:hypothetical protein